MEAGNDKSGLARSFFIESLRDNAVEPVTPDRAVFGDGDPAADESHIASDLSGGSEPSSHDHRHHNQNHSQGRWNRVLQRGVGVLVLLRFWHSWIGA